MNSLKTALADFAASQHALLMAVAKHDANHRCYLRNRSPPWCIPMSHRPPKVAIMYEPMMHELTAFTAATLRAKMLAYEAAYDGMKTPFTPNEAHIVVDTGASISITNCKSDFTTAVDPVQPATLKGFASGLTIEGIGSVQYSFLTDDGTMQDVILRNVLYVPKCSVHLLCPRHLAECTNIATDGFNSICDKGIYQFHVIRARVCQYY
jgi:hypothetical protein